MNLFLKKFHILIFANLIFFGLQISGASAQTNSFQGANIGCISQDNSTCIVYQGSQARPTNLAPGQFFDRRGLIRRGREPDHYTINHVGGPLEMIVTENRTNIAYSFNDDRGSRIAVKTNNTILRERGRPLCIHLPPGEYTANVWTRTGATPYRVRIFRRRFCAR